MRSTNLFCRSFSTSQIVALTIERILLRLGRYAATSGARQTGKKRAVGTLLISLGPAQVANSLCRWQEKHMMCKPDVQIGNSGSMTQGDMIYLSFPRPDDRFEIWRCACIDNSRSFRLEVAPPSIGAADPILRALAPPLNGIGVCTSNLRWRTSRWDAQCCSPGCSNGNLGK